MTEKKTFDRLRRCSFTEIKEIIEKARVPTPMYNFGDTVYQRAPFNEKLVAHLELIRLCDKHGWDLADLYLELEREAVTTAVSVYNNSIRFPDGIIERAKMVFPNAKFTEAKIELE